MRPTNNKSIETIKDRETGFGPDRRYNDYPFIVTKIEGALQHICLLSENLPLESLIEAAIRQESANKLPTCLVVGEGDCYYIENGAADRSHLVPFTGLPCAERLFVPDCFAASKARQRRLWAELKKLKQTGYINGEPSHGGRKPTAEELALLSGLQDAEVPKGLQTCPECGRWRGECLNPKLEPEYQLITVSCACQNENRCARCGEKLHDTKLKGNFVNEEDKRVWYTPGFCGLSHRCPDMPRRKR